MPTIKYQTDYLLMVIVVDCVESLLVIVSIIFCVIGIKLAAKRRGIVLACDFVAFRCPCTQINELAALTAKGTIEVVLPKSGCLAARTKMDLRHDNNHS